MIELPDKRLYPTSGTCKENPFLFLTLVLKLKENYFNNFILFLICVTLLAAYFFIHILLCVFLAICLLLLNVFVYRIQVYPAQVRQYFTDCLVSRLK